MDSSNANPTLVRLAVEYMEKNMEYYCTKFGTTPLSDTFQVSLSRVECFGSELAQQGLLHDEAEMTFDDSLIVRALIAYSFYLIEEEIFELEHDKSFRELLLDQVKQCFLLSGFFLSCKKIDRTFMVGHPPLSQLIRCACAMGKGATIGTVSTLVLSRRVPVAIQLSFEGIENNE